MKLSSKTKSVLSVFANFVSSFFMVIVAILAVLIVLIKLLGWSMFSVDSASMSPKYPVNTLIVVQSVSPEEIQVGDVITYSLNQDTLVTHRVVSINSTDQTFVTKGDANQTNDSAAVSWNALVGKVFIGIPYIGKLLHILTAEENRVAVIAVIVILFVMSVVWDIVERKKLTKADSSDTSPPTDSSQEG